MHRGSRKTLSWVKEKCVGTVTSMLHIQDTNTEKLVRAVVHRYFGQVTSFETYKFMYCHFEYLFKNVYLLFHYLPGEILTMFTKSHESNVL